MNDRKYQHIANDEPKTSILEKENLVEEYEIWLEANSTKTDQLVDGAYNFLCFLEENGLLNVKAVKERSYSPDSTNTL